MNRRFSLPLSIFFVAAVSCLTPVASAQVSLPDRFSYAAKFVCGLSEVPTTTPPSEPVVKIGNYATSVNIHNPWAVPATITKQIVISNPERYPNTRYNLPTKRVTDTVPSGSSIYVDCTEVVNLLRISGEPIPGPFIEGFIIIDSFFPPSVSNTSAADMDVVTVTTTAPPNAAGAPSGVVNSHEITPVIPKHLPKGLWPL